MVVFLELKIKGRLNYGGKFPLDFSKFPLKTNVFCVINSQSAGDVVYVQIRKTRSTLESNDLRDNLQLYFKIFFPHLDYEMSNFVDISDTVTFPKNTEIPNFLFKSISEEDRVLLTGLIEMDDAEIKDVFNGFPKIVNWLDDETQEKHPEFCCIRSGLSHIKLDSLGAYEKLNRYYPDEFVFVGKILKRNSINASLIRQKFIELMEIVQDTFTKNFNRKISEMDEIYKIEKPDNWLSITIQTNSPSYIENEIIVITGEVRDFYSGTPVSVIVKAPNGNLVSIAQVEVDADKKFSTEMTAGGALMKLKGAYIVTAQYGTVNRSAETTFEFGGGIIDDTTPEEDDSMVSDTMVKMGDGNGSIGYEITGGQLLSIKPDVDANSLIVGIDATSDGSLTLTIPRSVADALLETGEDDEFFVLVDGAEVDFSEDVTSTNRTLTIAFHAGDEEIEIIGTFVVPEFGTIAV